MEGERRVEVGLRWSDWMHGYGYGYGFIYGFGLKGLRGLMWRYRREEVRCGRRVEGGIGDGKVRMGLIKLDIGWR